MTPLHIALGYLLVKLHPLTQDQEPVYPYSATFTSALLHIVAREVLEICEPATFRSLATEVDALVKVECVAVAKRNDRLRNRGQAVSRIQEDAEEYEDWMAVFALEFHDPASGCSFLDHLEREIRDRISEKMDEDMAETQEPFEHRSPLGLFLRRLLVYMRKLSFGDTSHVSRQIAEWCDIRTKGYVNHKVALDQSIERRTSAMDEYQSALASGDYSLAIRSLRRFYDHTSPSTKSQHAHGLLNLAAFLYQTGGIESARAAVEEAIRIARKDGDKGCLQHCMSLLYQISAEGAGPSSGGVRRATLSHLSRPSTANDELNTLLTALKLGEPLPQALQRIHLALARDTPVSPLDLSAWHRMQGQIWDEMGIVELAQVHEDLAGEHVISRATKASRRDCLALGMLLEHCTEEMTHRDYTQWVGAISDILHHQAEMRHDDQSLSLLSALPNPTISPLQTNLRKSLKLLRTSSPAHTILPDVLRSLHAARATGAWQTYRFATVVLGETLLALDQGMEFKVVELIEGVWDSVMRGDDEEVKAMAALVLGKVEAANDDIGKSLAISLMIVKAVPHLKQSLGIAKKIHHRQVADQAGSLLALLADLTGSAERDRLAEEWQELKGESKFRSQVQQVLEIVRLVGLGVAR